MTTSLRHWGVLLLWLALLTFPSPGFAHRLDEYLQATLVAIEPGDIRLQMNLTPGVDVAEQVFTTIDRDHDGVISPDETAAYAARLKRDLIVRFDGRPLELELTASDCPAPAELRTGWGIIQLEFSLTPIPRTAGAHRLTFENRHLPAVSVYLFNAAQPRSDSVRIITQKRNDNQSTDEIEFTFYPLTNSSRVAGIAVLPAALLVVVFAVGWSARKRSPRSTSTF